MATEPRTSTVCESSASRAHALLRGHSLRALTVAAAAAAVACATIPPLPDLLPAPLAILTVNDEHPSMSPARFDHAAHARRAAAAGDDACAGCHHPLRDDPRSLPQACTECHVPSYLAPPRDESKPHRHDEPPDL